jgi:hypothetical protein
MKSGIELIAAERQRQLEVEDWNAQHDDCHDEGEMAQAAICYATPESDRKYHNNYLKPAYLKGWPWEMTQWKPSPDNRIKELTKAGALIAAEIDRLQRLP